MMTWNIFQFQALRTQLYKQEDDVQAISMTRPLCAPAIKAKHQFLSFEHLPSQQKTVFS